MEKKKIVLRQEKSLEKECLNALYEVIKADLIEKAKENNTTLSLLVRKRIFDYDNWFKGINMIKEIEKLEKGE